MSKTPGLKDFWYPWNFWPTMKTFTIWCGVAIEMFTFLSTILIANMEQTPANDFKVCTELGEDAVE